MGGSHTLLQFVHSETLLDSPGVGLLPLVPLTREGLQHEAIEQVIARLHPTGGEPHIDLLTLTYTLASLKYTKDEDLRWLKRSFAMIDELLKDSWVYKEWTQEATER